MMDRLVYNDDDDAPGSGEEWNKRERRSQPPLWKLGNGSLTKIAGVLTAVLLIAGFLLKATGWTLIGNSSGIAQNTAAIRVLEDGRETTTLALASSNAAIAGLTATTVAQSRDIAEMKGSLNAMMFMQCAMYQKLYVGAPPISECVKASASP